MRVSLLILMIIGLIACKDEPTNNTSIQNSEPAPTYATKDYPIVEYYQNKNGVPIYNGFLEVDTLEMSSGNKYMVNVVNYELWGKFLYLDKNYEMVATDNPDDIKPEDLGAFHPYLLRVSVRKNPGGYQLVQTVRLGISDNGVSNVHRTDFLKARMEGWNQQFSTKKNFTPCTTDDLKCKAEGILVSVVSSMFR